MYVGTCSVCMHTIHYHTVSYFYNPSTICLSNLKKASQLELTCNDMLGENKQGGKRRTYLNLLQSLHRIINFFIQISSNIVHILPPSQVLAVSSAPVKY